MERLSIYKLIRMVRGLGMGIGMSVIVAGCYEVGEEWVPLEGKAVSHNLIQFSQNGDFAAYAREAAIQRMEAQVELSRAQSIEYLNYDWRDELAYDDAGGIPMPSDGEVATDADADGDVSGDYSKTNTQEEGVGEADITITDGAYIYALTAGELVIVSAGADGSLIRVSSVLLGGYANEMFIAGDTAVVFSTLTEPEVPEGIHYKTRTMSNDKYDYGVEPDMGVPCEGSGCGYYGPGYAQIAIVDLSDRTSPEVIRTSVYAAQYDTSRRIGDSIRVVLYSALPVLDMDFNYGDGDWNTEAEVNRVHREMIESNTAYYNSLTLEDLIPMRIDSENNTPVPILSPSDITAPETPNGFGLQTIVSLNLADPMAEPLHSALFSQKGLVYASKESLYLTSARDYVLLAMESGLWGDISNETSGIHKFDISDGAVAARPVASGEVDGRLLDQFCLGEWNGDLRVATTTGNTWDGTEVLDNHVTILREKSGRLAQIGKLSGLGVGEEIYAARFIGDKGYLVTFLQTDPLFTLDLSDPLNPRKVGEWLGPGYSTYLHPWGTDRIIAVGEEDWQVTVSLYNIADFANPTMTTRLRFPENEYSSAVNDHKAFTFNPETGYLALPFSSWYDSFQTGVRTYQVSDEAIGERGSLNFYDTAMMNSESDATRSHYIGDFMYGVSRCRLVSAPINDPAATVASIPLFTSAACEDWGSYVFY